MPISFIISKASLLQKQTYLRNNIIKVSACRHHDSAFLLTLNQIMYQSVRRTGVISVYSGLYAFSIESRNTLKTCMEVISKRIYFT